MNHCCHTRREGVRITCLDCYQEWPAGAARPQCLMPRYADDRAAGARMGAYAAVAFLIGWLGALAWLFRNFSG